MPPEEDPEFQIAPMIDILLVLLVFFMSISSTEVLQTNKNVLLPVAKDAKQADRDTKGQTIVNVLWGTINQTGSVDVDDIKYDQPEMIIPYLEKKVRANDKMRVLVRADKQVKYEYLRAVMVAAAKAGVGNITFSVVDKEMGGAGSPAPKL